MTTINTSKLTQTHLERIKTLVDTLKSGKYSKAKRALRVYCQDEREYLYCPLGVACLVSDLGNWNLNEYKLEYDEESVIAFDYNVEKDTDDTMTFPLPQEVWEYYGMHLSDCNPTQQTGNILVYVDPGEIPEFDVDRRSVYKVSLLNDHYCDTSHEAIANLIEKTYLNN